MIAYLANPVESKGQAQKRPAKNNVINMSSSSVVREGTYFDGITKWYGKQDLSIHKLAGLECLWMLFGSLLPIFVDSILRKLLLNIDFIDAVKQNLKSGEIFLLTSALIMPFCFVIITYINSDEENKKINQLPYFGWVLFLTIVALLTGLFTFLYYRIGQLVRAQAESDVVKTMFSFEFGNWAFVIFIMSLFIWYYSSYMNHRSTTAYKNIRKKQQNKLESDFDSNNVEEA
jgi:ABC-type multidrug transport system fused ATPase/permease subunit